MFVEDITNLINNAKWSEQRRNIVKMYLGVEFPKAYSKTEIANQLNVSRQRISQLLDDSLPLVQNYIAKNYPLSFPDAKPLKALKFEGVEERNLYIFESYYGLNGRAQKKFEQICKEVCLGQTFVKKIVYEYKVSYEQEHNTTLSHTRIAPETYLKQCIAGGFDRVYEVAKCFRNEGMDTEHLQEFTQVEWYASYWNFEDNIKFYQGFIKNLLLELVGTTTLEYQGYTYRDIHFDGVMGVEEISGQLHILDENITLQLNGLADWSEEDTRLDITARIANLRPHAINLTDKYPELSVNAMTYISLFTSGSRKQMLDNLTGYLIIDTLDVRNGDKRAMMEQLKLDIDNLLHDGESTRYMRLQSDYLTANISGDFQYRTLPHTIQNLLNTYLPSLIPHSKQKNEHPNTLDFYAYFRGLDTISNLLDLPYSLPSYPTIKGFINERVNQIGLQAHVPHIQTSGTQIEDLTVSLENSRDALDMAVYMYNRLPKDNPTAAKIGDVKIKVNLNVLEDSVDMKIHLDNTDSVRNAGTIHISSLIKKYANII